MKSNKIYAFAAAIAMSVSLASCDGEKDLIIIEGKLPIKTSVLYMVGDATPVGWNIDNPLPMEAGADDPLVFAWEGSLFAGELKLCVTTGSWDAGFIRPTYNGAEIGRETVSDAEFVMSAGDPDNKWKVTEPGIYRLVFNLREWTMSSVFVGEASAPEIEPIEADAFYLVGDATPNGWAIDAPNECRKESKYIFIYEGELKPGEMKACTSTGSWDVSFVRPASDGCAIGKNGAEADGFVYTASPDHKWRVTDHGEYRLTFDLEHWKIQAEFIKEIVVEKNPIETETLFMIGDATPNGWSMDNATEFTVDPSDSFIFTWEGDLVTGTFKACTERDGTFSCPFIRPESPDCEISSAGVAAPGFVYTTSPDDQWRVTEAGHYRLTFNLRDWTISAEMTGDKPDLPDTPDDPADAIEAETVYLIGDATPNGWSMDNATEMSATSDRYVFVWEGVLTTGELKACTERDGTFSCPFLRPVTDGCSISRNGVADPALVFTAGDPDNKWRVADAGRYRLTFNLSLRTINAEYLD
ncbi:MAG: SusF/SusE family outer membrane protein [Muribaculaceae bacterium]|nr:SusF/SusE family outer membrane protein [Muribaculaceae bacterium]